MNLAFQSVVPDQDASLRQVEQTSTLGLPEARPEPVRGDTLQVFASGPSGGVLGVLGVLAASGTKPTLALNGAIRTFTRQGLAPTYWAGCDPQESLADLLEETPASTRYFVASKCHPKVFEKLKDRDVVVWHVNDTSSDPYAVPTAISITLTALSLMRMKGFKSFDVRGWDCCYIDNKGYAIDQAPPDCDDINVQLPDGQTFRTKTTWAAECQDAIIQLMQADYTVNIHGNGLVKAMKEAYDNA